MNVIGWLLLGALTGSIASPLLGSRDGLSMSMVIGIAGAFIGGFMFALFGGGRIADFSIWSMVFAVLGAVVLCGVVAGVRVRRRPAPES